MSNPFATGALPESSAAEAPTVEASSPFEDTVTPEVDVEEVEVEVSVDEETEYGSFEKQDKAKQAQVPYSRLAKVIAQRNDTQRALSEAEKSLAHVQGKLESLQKLEGVFADKYKANPALAQFDATFMEKFDELAATNPSLAQAAALVKAAMGNTVIDDNDNSAAPEQETPAAPASSNPVMDRLLLKEVKSSFTSALGEHVKPQYIEAISRDVLKELSPAELADATPAQIIEMAKLYFKETGLTAADYAAPKKAGAAPKPATRGSQGAPTAASTPAEQKETPKYKTIDEYNADRGKRFAAITKDIFGEE